MQFIVCHVHCAACSVLEVVSIMHCAVCSVSLDHNSPIPGQVLLPYPGKSCHLVALDFRYTLHILALFHTCDCTVLYKYISGTVLMLTTTALG